MTTLIFVFFAALLLALAFTPLVLRLALRFHMVRQPNGRDAHTKSKPRLGGIALYVSFFLALTASIPFQTEISTLLYDHRYLAILCGASLMFITGLVDDLYHLKSSTKLLSQIIAGFITWYGGVQIGAVSISLSSGAEIGWLSLPITIFWIVLVTNAINLIDGLDGLAAGVTLFVSVMMLVLCVTNQNYITAIGFAALAGSTLGFLRYNFNPASIFMGDSGSYFLGYSIATLSILGSVKGQATLAMLIPFVALGVPIFDTLLSPLRRFARGKKMFSPDNKHLHHKLMESGESHRNTVLIIYAITVLLSISAFTLIYAKDEQSALILIVPGVILFLLFRKIGYLNYLAIDKIYGWLRDITDSTRISHDSRTFLDHQVEIHSAQNIDDMWAAAEKTFAFLGLDHALLSLAPYPEDLEVQPETFRWAREAKSPVPHKGYRFKIEYPLLVRNGRTIFLGRLIIHKYTQTNPIRQFTIRRIEQLQRDITKKLIEFRLPDTITNDQLHPTSHPHIAKN